MTANNRIENVAIIGATGHVGQHFVQELLKTGKHTVTAVSRADSKGVPPPGVKVARVNYDDQESLVSALRGQDFLVVTVPAAGAEGLHAKVSAAAARAGVPYVMPNSYGYDVENEALYRDIPNGPGVLEAIRSVTEHGGGDAVPAPAAVIMTCGFWYEWSLCLGEPWFGFDIRGRKVAWLDGGSTRISVSTWAQCGRALAALLSLPERGPASSPALSHWSGRQVVFSSFRVSQRDILDSLNRVLGTSDADWTFTHESSRERFDKGLEDLKKGEFMGFVRSLYSRVLFPSGDGDLENSKTGTQNKLLGLPEEDLDEATKRAVDLAESGWSPFA